MNSASTLSCDNSKSVTAIYHRCRSTTNLQQQQIHHQGQSDSRPDSCRHDNSTPHHISSTAEVHDDDQVSMASDGRPAADRLRQLLRIFAERSPHSVRGVLNKHNETAMFYVLRMCFDTGELPVVCVTGDFILKPYDILIYHVDDSLSFHTFGEFLLWVGKVTCLHLPPQFHNLKLVTWVAGVDEPNDSFT